MAKEYTIRNIRNELISQVSGVTARNILRDAAGFWREYTTHEYVETRCFEIERDAVYEISGLEIFLWKGYLIVEES